MKLIIRLLLIVILTYLFSLIGPWWIGMVVAALTGFLLHGNGFNVFISGFLGIGLLWMIYAWYLDAITHSILSEKIVALFPFEDKIFLVVAAGLIGGLTGGFSCLTGNSFRQLFLKKKTKSFYN